MTKDEFLQMNDDEKWNFVAGLANVVRTFDDELFALKVELSRLSGSSFSEDNIIEDLQGRLKRKLKKYEKMRVISFFAYAKRNNFKWKDGNDMIRSELPNYLFSNITKIEGIF